MVRLRSKKTPNPDPEERETARTGGTGNPEGIASELRASTLTGFPSGTKAPRKHRASSSDGTANFLVDLKMAFPFLMI
jgi:hypothetical protein